MLFTMNLMYFTSIYIYVISGTLLRTQTNTEYIIEIQFTGEKYLENKQNIYKKYGITISNNLLVKENILINAKMFNSSILTKFELIKNKMFKPKELIKELLKDLSFTKLINFLCLFGEDVHIENKNEFSKNVKAFLKHSSIEYQEEIINNIIENKSNKIIFDFIYKYSFFARDFFIFYNGLLCRVSNENIFEFRRKSTIKPKITFTISKIENYKTKDCTITDYLVHDRLLFFFNTMSQLGQTNNVELNFIIIANGGKENADEVTYGRCFIEGIKLIVKNQNTQELNNNYLLILEENFQKQQNVYGFLQFNFENVENSDSEFNIDVKTQNN